MRFPYSPPYGRFWEQLGRTIAIFGYLEEVLGRAILVLTAKREYGPNDIDEAYAKWPGQLERAASDPLGGLSMNTVQL